MKDVRADIEAWAREGSAFALATVVQTWGSAPRGAGSKMGIAADGRITGSVSGGCVEAAVIEAARKTLRDGVPQLLHFGVADETAWAVGLACGGTIDVFVEKAGSGLLDELRSLSQRESTAVRATVIAGPLLGQHCLLQADGVAQGSLGEGDSAGAVRAAAEAALSQGKSARATLGESQVFLDVVGPAPTLVAVGGVHIAIALTRIAQALGYRTIVVDPRPAFANEARFPHADRVVSDWPDEALGRIGLTAETAVAVLTHDPKLDDPALRAALPSPAFYVGALGSKATQAKRRQRLLEGGLSEEHLGRLHAPIGLDLGGRSPEEIALSVMAQVVAVKNGGGVRR